MTTEETMRDLFGFFLSQGFCYEYAYDKSSDHSCVYIHKFRHGYDFFDLREVTGGKEISFVVYAGGRYRFPSLAAYYKKEFRRFRMKHLFKKPTDEERYRLIAEALSGTLRRVVNGEISDFFGILL